MVLRGDHGTEFVSIALLQWATDRGLHNLLIEPGKPRQNGASESFKGKLRDECSAMNWFYSRIHAKVIIEPYANTAMLSDRTSAWNTRHHWSLSRTRHPNQPPDPEFLDEIDSRKPGKLRVSC
jgi:putative transposase